MDTSAAYAWSVMVESNHDEERLARIEHMVEGLQREQVANKIITTRLIAAVAVVAESAQAPEPVRPKRKSERGFFTSSRRPR